jgi:hypothetical protein
MSYPTIEVRWFWQGQSPAEIEQYFAQGAVPTVEEREDWYLQLPGQDTLGIKLREGKVEIKKRVGDRGICQLSDQVLGRVEEWMKWSFSSDVEPTLFLESEFRQEWVVIQKARRQKTYQILNQKIVEVIESDALAQGCNVEIATLQIQDQTWLSFGFEAFGRYEQLQETFNQVARHILKKSRFPPLPAEHSFSYPCWLSAVLQHQI